MTTSYFDSSALVKLVVSEPESSALRRYSRSLERRVSSELSRVEVLRAVRSLGAERLRQARELFRALDLIPLETALLESAALIEPQSVRTLDSIHLASAVSLGDELDELVTYDRRMTEAAEEVAISVVSPG